MAYFKQFMDWAWERLGITTPKLVATIEHEIFWMDEDDDDDDGIEETITFFLLEYPSGRRDYSYDSYGHNLAKGYHEFYIAEVMAWVYGGPLPKDARKANAKADIIRMVKTDKPVPPSDS